MGFEKLTGSFCCCFSGFKPPTPNFDKLRDLLAKFVRLDPNHTNHAFLGRASQTELCAWTQLLVDYLSSVDESPNSQQPIKEIETHFSALKKFYSAYKTAGQSSESLDLLFDSLQIYEGVLAASFVVLKDHPAVMKCITAKINEATAHLQKEKEKKPPCCSELRDELVSENFGLLKCIDVQISFLGTASIARVFETTTEVMCRLYDIEDHLFLNMENIGESIQQLVVGLSSTFEPMFGGAIPTTNRKSKYSALEMTERINAKLSAFKTDTAVVGRTVTCFRSLYQAIEAADNYLINARAKDITKLQANKHPIEIAAKNALAHRQIDSLGKFFGDLEIILVYGVLIFKDEKEILVPVLEQIDESTRIIRTYSSLHPLYKVFCGEAYLSKVRLVILSIVRLLEESKLNLRYPSEFLAEVSHLYPTLLTMVCKPVNPADAALYHDVSKFSKAKS